MACEKEIERKDAENSNLKRQIEELNMKLEPNKGNGGRGGGRIHPMIELQSNDESNLGSEKESERNHAEIRKEIERNHAENRKDSERIDAEHIKLIKQIEELNMKLESNKGNGGRGGGKIHPMRKLFGL